MTAPIGFTDERISRVTAFSGACPASNKLLSGKTIFTFTTNGVGVDVKVGVRVAVDVNVEVGVRETVGVKVKVDVNEGVTEAVLLGRAV